MCDERHVIYTTEVLRYAMRGFIDGYEHYIRFSGVRPDNPYLIQRQAYYYKKRTRRLQSIIDIDIIEECRQKFVMLADMKENGYCDLYPIKLRYGLKFARNQILHTIDGKELLFQRIDGHHRIAASAYCRIEKIPVLYRRIRPPVISYEEILEKIGKGWFKYQPVDFGIPEQDEIPFRHKESSHFGMGKFNHVLRQYLQPIQGNKFLDLGCNIGVITAAIAAQGARLVVGIDYKKKNIEQANWLRKTVWGLYGNMRFGLLNLRETSDLKDRLLQLSRGPVHCILMANVLYHLGDKADEVISILSSISPKIILQGNKAKRNEDKTLFRSEKYDGLYATTEGMVDILNKYDYQTIIDDSYKRVVVVGIK